MVYTYAIDKQPNPILDEHYLILHTLRGATAHSSCVAGGVASLPLPNSEVEDLLICLQWSRPHGAAAHLTGISYCSLSWTDNKQLQSHKASDDRQF
jgi:hypothetical protein